MTALSQWLTIAGPAAIYCNVVTSYGRRVHGRHAIDRRTDARKCSRTVMTVGNGKTVKIRVVAGPGEHRPPGLAGHSIRCKCQTIYEFEEVPMITTLQAAQ